MKVGCFILTWDSIGLHVERDPRQWKITRPWARAGVSIGLVWGPWRFPFRWDGDQWRKPPIFTLRSPVSIQPWFHAWRWPDRLLAKGYAAWMALSPYIRQQFEETHHPARLYFGGKLFYVWPVGEFDTDGNVWAREDERGRNYTTTSASFRRGGLGR